MLDQKDLEMITEIVDKVVGSRIVEPIEKRLEAVETKVNTLDYSIRDIKLTLENETNKQIKIVAEGHAVLNRKLDEALKSDNEREILKLRLVHLENEIRQIKERLAVI